MNISRRFAAWAIGSSADPFRAARLKLTLVYIAIITAIVLVLSASLYEFHTHDIAGIGRSRPIPELADRPSLEDASGLGEYLERLGRSIIFADIITIVFGGAAGFLLATRTLRPIKEAVRAEQQFFANAAHDLRTPLAVMRSEAEVALRSNRLTEADARKLVGSSLEEIDRMSAMVEQMLNLARKGATGDAGASPRMPMDLSAMALGVTAKMSRRAEERGVRLFTDAPEPALMDGYPPSVERAVYNVVENAVAYTPAGGTVRVSVRRRGGHVLLEVTDTGIGISPEDLPHITEPFYRGDRARSAHSGGAGLGLTIAKAAMDDHHGTLHAASRPGAGTTISLRFPSA